MATDTAVANGTAVMALTTNSLSSTPSFQIAASPFERTIGENRHYTVRAAGTGDYSNFQLVFGHM